MNDAYIRVKFASLICKTSRTRKEAEEEVLRVMPDFPLDVLRDFRPYLDIGENHVR